MTSPLHLVSKGIEDGIIIENPWAVYALPVVTQQLNLLDLSWNRCYRPEPQINEIFRTQP